VEIKNRLGRKRRPLSPRFYETGHVTDIAHALLGKLLVTDFDKKRTTGLIIETEAYSGEGDMACHSHSGKRTARTEIMFGPGGYAYVYLCYGIHSLFNIITNVKEKADAVLIRAIEPVDGIETMCQRRGHSQLKKQTCAGPGCVTQALGITRDHYGLRLDGKELRIEDAGVVIEEPEIHESPRIGVEYAGEDALLPWRYTIKGSPWVSK